MSSTTDSYHGDTPREADEDLLLMNSADAMSYALEIAGVGARSYAFVIDWHIRLLIALVWIWAVSLLLDNETIQNLFSDESGAAGWILLLPAGIIYFFYHPILETVMRGSTPGKRIAGVRLVTLEGHTTSVGNILVRNLFRLVDSIPGVYTVGLVVAMFTRNHVRIGDIAAGTVLVYDRQAGAKKLADIARQPVSPGIGNEQMDLLHELLDRWAQLEADQRVHLGRRMLRMLDDALESDDQGTIRKRLLEIAGRKR